MSSSEALSKYKKLYYQEDRAILDYSVEDSSAEIKMEGASNPVVISSTDPDFIGAVSNIVETVREGKKQLIDLESTPVERSETFFDNLSLFGTDLDNPVIESIKKKILEKYHHQPI